MPREINYQFGDYGEEIHQFVLLCAGKGQRMGELVRNCPKCLLTFRGKIMLKYVLENISNDFMKAKVILVINRKGDAIKQFFGEKYKELTLEYVYQEQEESKSALVSAEKLIKKSHFFVIEANIIIEDGFLPSLVNEEVLATLTYSKNNHIARTHSALTVIGDSIEKIEIYKKGLVRKGKVTCMGSAYMSKKLLDYCKKLPYESIMECLQKAIELGEKVNALEYTGEWFHFAYPKDLLK